MSSGNIVEAVLAPYMLRSTMSEYKGMKVWKF